MYVKAEHGIASTSKPFEIQELRHRKGRSGPSTLTGKKEAFAGKESREIAFGCFELHEAGFVGKLSHLTWSSSEILPWSWTRPKRQWHTSVSDILIHIPE